MNKITLKKLLQNILLESKQTYSKQEMIDIISTNLPKITIEINKGEINLEWGELPLPFSYGEFTDFINPVDNMGWDLIIAPSSQINPNLEVVGTVNYRADHPKFGNDKIILSTNGMISEDDKEIITNYFTTYKSSEFEPPIYFTSISENWEKSIFTKYKLTPVKDERFSGIGVGSVARRTFYNS